MNNLLMSLMLTGLITYQHLLFPVFESPKTTVEAVKKLPENEFVREAFEILDTKCNVCHRKQNPFKVFSLKNMNKHAPRIHDQVFVKKRMPKGEEIKLSDQEYQTLKQWLASQNIF